ncbi:MAG: penicillin amidase [Natrialbaceae archaeon]|jgi:penicillin amidase
MDREMTRRALVGAVVGGGIGAGFLSPVSGYLRRFAPFAGQVWGAARRDGTGTVTNPYGEATLQYDDYGVAHVEGATERSLYFALGYAQAADRLFQMDLQRRQMRGELSAIVGDGTLSSDRFHVAMDFAGAAEATWDGIDGSETGNVVQAFVDGVNRYIEDEPLPLEFRLLEYEPDRWSGTDVMLGEKQISWGLTGSFRTLRKATVANEIGPEQAEKLYPYRMDHDVPIIREGVGEFDAKATAVESAATAVDPDLLSWLSAFESPPGVGSNSWVVSGEHTESGKPILANDPHLTLNAPPVWYETNLRTDDLSVRGVTFPGVPFVIIGENHAGTWGVTNTATDVIDFYRYDTRDGTYRYGDEWREFETETRTIAVADGEDREVTVRKTIHGPVIGTESDGDELVTEVGIAWTGFAATKTVEAVRRMSDSDGVESFREALRDFDLPPQNCVYADRDGNILYSVTGRHPRRYTDGEPVRGTQVFDGSEQEGEWPGYTPYDESSWDGFVPFEEKPHLENPEYLGTANQRIIDDDRYPYYLAEGYGAPFRGRRLWERLDRRMESPDPVTPGFMRELQDDAYDKRAELFVQAILRARETIDDDLDGELDRLGAWDYRMTRDSRAALLFARFVDHYRREVFEGPLQEALDERRGVEEYFPNDWVLLHFDDEDWFPEGRDAAIATAFEDAINEIESNDWTVYGDYNVTEIDHPFGQSWLEYPRLPTDGSKATLNNFRKEAGRGSSWRQVCPMGDAPSQAVLPGGNDGDYFSDHYADQLELWANGEYRSFSREISGRTAITFDGGDDS